MNIKDFFKNDLFAAENGIELQEVRKGYSKATHGTLAFSLSSNIQFLRASGEGDTLTAEARERYIGRSTGCYQIDITNQDGKLIATFESSVFRMAEQIPVEVP